MQADESWANSVCLASSMLNLSFKKTIYQNLNAPCCEEISGERYKIMSVTSALKPGKKLSMLNVLLVESISSLTTH